MELTKEQFIHSLKYTCQCGKSAQLQQKCESMAVFLGDPPKLCDNCCKDCAKRHCTIN